MIVSAKKLPINRNLGDVVIANAAPFSIMQIALYGLGAFWLWTAWKGSRR